VGRHRKKLAAWTGVTMAALLVAVAVSGYLVVRHLNGNIAQANISGMLGKRPADLHPQAENILVIGSDSRLGTAAEAWDTTDQSDTMMLVHIPASRQWAEVMSIPRDSYVNIPSCEMGNGKMSTPTRFKINEAFAIGNLYGNRTALGTACAVKTVEQDTGIYIDHFLVLNFAGFEGMVSALGGVPECNPVAFTNPHSRIRLPAGYHLLTPRQALAYVRARKGLGDGSDLERITRQQAFVSSLISRARSELLNPLAMYRFLNAATSSLTIDSQFGGIRGLYNLEQSLHGLPSSKITLFTLPNFPRAEVAASDTANVLWTQPEDDRIFASFRDDVPAGAALTTALPQRVPVAARPGKFGVSPTVPAGTASPGAAPVTVPGGRSASQSICVG